MVGEDVSGLRRKSLLRSAGVIGFATFLSRITGLVREQVIAILFGAGNATDAYNVAFRIPNLLRDLFAEGAMSASLVPTFTRVQAEDGQRRAWRLAGLVFRVLAVGVGVLTLLGIVFAPQLAALYASAYELIPGKFELTVRMTRIMFPFFPLVVLAAAFMGILNARGVFFLPALASALFNVTSVIVGGTTALVLFRYGPALGIQPIEGMALGVVAGGLVQALCQLPALYRQGYRWEARQSSDPVWYRDPGLRRMLWMMVPGTVGLAATQVNILVNTILATSQGSGAVSWLNYAFRLMQFPIGVFGVSLAQATLPLISRQWVERDVAGVSETITHSLRRVLAVNLPASAGLAFLGYPIIELIFQYGRFYAEDTRATSIALAMYAVGLAAYSAVKVLVPACYALGNTRLPVISSVMTVAVTIVLNLIMIRPFGYWGLALGTSIGAILNGVFLVFVVKKLIEGGGGAFSYGPLFRSFIENLGVALLMGVVCLASHRMLNGWWPDAFFVENFGKGVLPFVRGAKVLAVVFEGVVIVAISARVFGLRDTAEVVNLFAEKLKKVLSRRKR